MRAAQFPEARVRRVVRSYCSPVAVRAALRTCGKLSNLRRTVTIALVVGCILGLNFVVPFVVSNLGVLAGTRTAQT